MNLTPFQWIWLLLLIACIVWYSTVTIYVAIRGAFDIRSMLQRLGEHREQND